MLQTVDVVITYFNDYDTIREALDSVFSQSYPINKVILIDDCSKNPPPTDIVNDPRILYKRNDLNLGGGGSRNAGIKQSKADFIAFLDADDRWCHDKLKSQFSALNESKSDIIFSGCFLEYPSGKCKSHFASYTPGEDVSEYMFDRNKLIQSSGLLVSNLVFKAINFPEIKRHQDYLFCLEAQASGFTLSAVNEPQYFFLQKSRRVFLGWGYSFDFWRKYNHLMTEKGSNGFLKNIVMKQASKSRDGLMFIRKTSQPKIFYYYLLKIKVKELVKNSLGVLNVK